MIQINPLKSYIDGGVRAALTTPPSASLVFDLPGKAIWVKGVKLKGTDHTYTFSHDNYITLTNTPDSNESEDIKIGVNTSALKSAIDTTYGVVSITANGLAPKFTSGNKQAAAAATTYYFLGWAGSTLKWYQAPFRNIRINSETTDCLGVNNTDPLIIGSGNGISVTWDSTNKKIIITNTKPDVNHNTDTKVAQSVTTQNKNYAIILKGNDSDEGSITTVNFSTYLKFNPSTKQLTINGSKVITTIDTFAGATTSADGSVGLVTKPLIANRLQFLRGDGTWATPIDTWRPVKVEGTEKLGSNALDLSAGNGISIIYNSDTKKIIITNTKPDVNHNTHYTTMLYIGENNDTKANKNIANPYLKLFDDNTRRTTFQIKAGSGIAVASDANGNITITNSAPDVNHNTDITVKQTPKTDNINRPLMMINGGTSTGEQINTSMFSTGIYANASTKMITANGFIKAGSSNSYVLLGGGSHKTESSLSVANADKVDGQHFSYSNSSNSPTYLWATNSNGSSFLATRGSISVNYANYSGYATKLDGGAIAGWGTLTSSNGFSGIAAYDWGNKGAFCWAGKSGQMYMQVDGWFYQNEGRYRVLDTSDAGSLSVKYASSAGNADTVDGYHASSFVRESSASYNKSDGVAGWMRIAEQSPGTNVEYSIANSWYNNECNTLTFIVSYNYYNSTTPQITVLSSGTSLYPNIRIIGTDAKVGYVEVYISSSSANNTYYLNARRLNIYGWCTLYTTYRAGSGTATREIGSLNNSIGFASSGNINAAHFYENSDIRYKNVLNNLTITINNIATLPIFNFKWKEDNSICTGTSAQAVQEILPNIVSGTDRLTLDYGVLGTIAGITACKELITQKSELQELKEKVKQLEDKLSKYENTL